MDLTFVDAEGDAFEDLAAFHARLQVSNLEISQLFCPSLSFHKCSRFGPEPSTWCARLWPRGVAHTSAARSGRRSPCGPRRPEWGSCSGGSRVLHLLAQPPRPCGRARWLAWRVRGRANQSLDRPIEARTRPRFAPRDARRTPSSARW